MIPRWCLLVLFAILAALPALACDESEHVATCQCGCGGTPRPYCAYRDCVCAKTRLALPQDA
ncbi:MAG: hypothetical protein FJX76_07300 [Armatimonadetes bacterium]|nr:hypothetical protein [Armatimonadota bacterium]